jgi:hypothetical protein
LIDVIESDGNMEVAAVDAAKVAEKDAGKGASAVADSTDSKLEPRQQESDSKLEVVPKTRKKRRFLASRDVRKMKRLHNLLSAWLREIEYQMQNWASFYPENKYYNIEFQMQSWASFYPENKYYNIQNN